MVNIIIIKSSASVSHFFDLRFNPINLMILYRFGAWNLWPRNHEHRVVLSVLYLKFFCFTRRFNDLFPPLLPFKFPASSTRPQFLRNEIPTFQAQCIRNYSSNKIAKAIGPMVGHHPTLTEGTHEKTVLFVERAVRIDVYTHHVLHVHVQIYISTCGHVALQGLEPDLTTWVKSALQKSAQSTVSRTTSSQAVAIWWL